MEKELNYQPEEVAAFEREVWSRCAESYMEAFGLFFSVVKEHAGSTELPHGPLFGVSDFDAFHQMMKDAGFSDTSVRELSVKWETSSIDSYITSFSDWANLESFPLNIKEDVITAVREKAKAYYVDNTFVMPNPLILISGTK